MANRMPPRPTPAQQRVYDGTVSKCVRSVFRHTPGLGSEVCPSPYRGDTLSLPPLSHDENRERAGHTPPVPTRLPRDAARALRVPRETIRDAVNAVRLWRRLSGWNDRYGLALRTGFCDSDARLHATQEADYRTRTGNLKR